MLKEKEEESNVVETQVTSPFSCVCPNIQRLLSGKWRQAVSVQKKVSACNLKTKSLSGASLVLVFQKAVTKADLEKT